MPDINRVTVHGATYSIKDAEGRELISTLDTSLTAANARIDTFTHLTEGSTTGDAELIDARIGTDGTVYESAGEAIRSQISELETSIVFPTVDEATEYLSIDIDAYVFPTNEEAEEYLELDSSTQ